MPAPFVLAVLLAVPGGAAHAQGTNTLPAGAYAKDTVKIAFIGPLTGGSTGGCRAAPGSPSTSCRGRPGSLASGAGTPWR